MKTYKNWARQCALCVVAALLFANALSGTAAAQSSNSYNVSLALADQSVDSQGRTVITMMATGDLPGVLTLAFTTTPDGTITDGEWALVVSYTAPLNPNAAPDPSLPDPDSAVGEQLIQRGVLKGTITTGAVTFANGGVDTLTGVEISVTGGTVQFASVPNGNGIVAGSNTTDRNNSTGSVSLNF